MTDKELGAAAGDIFAKAFTLGYETGRKYALFPATEPAEDVKPRPFEVGDPEPEDRDTIILRGASRGGVAAEFRFGRYATTGLHDNPDAWWRTDQDEPIYAPWDFWLEQFGPLTEVQTAPAEPAEEETKAELCAVRLCVLPARHSGVHADREGLRWNNPTSSPVVPAPTETGPWQRIEDVPESVGRLTDRDGDDWEWDGDNWVTPETAILPTTYINRNFAPFVAAEEG